MTTDPDPPSRRPFYLGVLACGLLTLALGLVTQTADGRTRRPGASPAVQGPEPAGEAPPAPQPIPGG